MASCTCGYAPQFRGRRFRLPTGIVIIGMRISGHGRSGTYDCYGRPGEYSTVTYHGIMQWIDRGLEVQDDEAQEAAK